MDRDSHGSQPPTGANKASVEEISGASEGVGYSFRENRSHTGKLLNAIDDSLQIKVKKLLSRSNNQ